MLITHITSLTSALSIVEQGRFEQGRLKVEPGANFFHPDDGLQAHVTDRECQLLFEWLGPVSEKIGHFGRDRNVLYDMRPSRLYIDSCDANHLRFDGVVFIDCDFREYRWRFSERIRLLSRKAACEAFFRRRIGSPIAVLGCQDDGRQAGG